MPEQTDPEHTETDAPQPDETILGGESSVPGTAGTAAGGVDQEDHDEHAVRKDGQG